MPNWNTIMARRERTFVQRVFFDSKDVSRYVTGITYDYGWDSVVGTVQVELSSLQSWIQFAKEIKVELGWDGYRQGVFKGLVVKKAPERFPLRNAVHGEGYLARTRKPYSADVTYDNTYTCKGIIADLLTKCNVPYDPATFGGTDRLVCSVADYELKDGFTPWSAIEECDKVDEGWRTFETSPDGKVIRRQIVLGVPAAGYKYSWEEGVDEVHISREQSIQQLYNRVTVTGLAGEDIVATVRGDSPYVDRDYTTSLSSELIQAQDHAVAVAQARHKEVNRIPDVLTVRLPGRPDVQPGETCRLKQPELGITAWTNYWIRHVHGASGDGGWWLDVTVEGGTGAEGYLEPLPPEAVFDVSITRETVEVSGVQTNLYTVVCTDLSYDPDGTIASYAWSNNKNADVGTGETYSTAFTEAEASNATLPSITLTVTDGDGLTSTFTRELDVTIESVVLRQLYSAATARAEATPSGGETWYTHTPASGAIQSTPDRAGEDHSYFGNGAALEYTGDQLATAPSAVHTFASTINTISVCETNASRVSVGLESGAVYATDDAHNLAAAVWAKLATFEAPVRWLTENPYSPGLYGVASGSGFYLLYGSTGTAVGWFAFGANDIARKHIGSPFANYGCATLDAGSTELSPVKREDGVAITFPEVVPPVRDVWALAHHPKDDVLWAADDDLAGNARVWRKPAGLTAFEYVTSIAGAGFPRHLKSDADHPGIVYLNCDDGLYKSFDFVEHWYRMRDYSAVGVAGVQLGFGAASWIPDILATGKEVYVAGTDASGYPVFAYSLNLWEGTPVFVASNTGLPAAALGSVSLERAPDGGVYLKAGTTIYYNAAPTGGGSWSVVMGSSVIASVTGISAGSIRMGLPGTSAAAGDGFIAVNTEVYNYGSYYLEHSNWVFHSHDHGTTWTGVDTGQSGGVYSYYLPHNVAVGRTDGDVLYAFSDRLGEQWVEASTDGGHTFSRRLPGMGGGFIALQPESNPSDLIGVAAGARSIDGWVSASANGAQEHTVFAPSGGAAVSWSTAGNSLYRSDDYGVTWQLGFSDGSPVWDTADMDVCRPSTANIWYKVMMGGGLTLGIYTCTDDTLATWTLRNGNLLTLVPTPTAVRVNPEV